jgi:toxin CcdB
MAQFDLYRNPAPSAQYVPYLLDVQSDLLRGIATRIIVPLFHEKAFGPVSRRLNPFFEIEKNVVVMSTAEIAGVLPTALGEKIGSLADQRDAIRDALDFAFQGFSAGLTPSRHAASGAGRRWARVCLPG